MVPEDIAAKFRDDHGYSGRGGVVVVFEGEACGWVDKLRNPEHWRHGAIAVDEQGAKWKALGTADVQNGVPGADDSACTWWPLPGNPLRAKRGRPVKVDSMSGAERQRAYKEKQLAQGKSKIDGVWVSSDVKQALQRYVERHNADKAVEPITLGDAVDRLLRDRLLRKR